MDFSWLAPTTFGFVLAMAIVIVGWYIQADKLLMAMYYFFSDFPISETWRKSCKRAGFHHNGNPGRGKAKKNGGKKSVSSENRG